MTAFLKRLVSQALSNLRKEVRPTNNIKKFATEATIKTKPYKLHRLDTSPLTEVKVTKEEAKDYYKKMFILRSLENATFTLAKANLIRGFCHIYSGEEAAAVGAYVVMTPEDLVASPYRIHGWAYLMGNSVLGVLAEMTARTSACQRGKGGSMHMYHDRFFGGFGIVGSSVPVGTGLAFALKYKGVKGVGWAIYGDGAANQGQVFEAFNLAKLWNLPCLFYLENNGYGYSTSIERAAANIDFYTRGDLIPGIWVDGMDVISVREAIKFAREFCLEGNGPIVVEAATYRYHGHSISDPGTTYRTREEIQAVRQQRDPITTFKALILEKGLLIEEEIKSIETEVKTDVNEASERAVKDPIINASELTTDIYSECLEPHIRNITPFNPLQHKRLGRAINLK
ncbi:probable pyruvate dehydrogenase E1 component subunit alpha, mitochondrial [Agrilus planipennis]|uniref:pyruvate dehydrogenase (acetyl-transferring) n=1 Tax=Agrilus planipennis TaxID=224129 RepID=A0A1W4XCH9_AGRPL|nr:probable pyruvate dehydrogenase E1 component subunit alpha, mitochondrial [Agrilus planipennis]